GRLGLGDAALVDLLESRRRHRGGPEWRARRGRGDGRERGNARRRFGGGRDGGWGPHGEGEPGHRDRATVGVGRGDEPSVRRSAGRPRGDGRRSFGSGARRGANRSDRRYPSPTRGHKPSVYGCVILGAGRAFRSPHPRRGGWLGRISTRLTSERAGNRSRSSTASATSDGWTAQSCFWPLPRPNSVFTLPGIT